MASKYWIKLYHEILDDPKMGKLSDRLFRRTIELFLMAGEWDELGDLPSLDDMAWRLRTSPELLETELIELSKKGVITAGGGGYSVTNFSIRQTAMSNSERARRWREKNNKTNWASELYKGLPASPGIYRILCTETGRSYIGATNNIHTRVKQHLYLIAKDEHPMAEDILDYGPECISISILEHIEDESLLSKKEGEWIDKFPADDLYNKEPSKPHQNWNGTNPNGEKTNGERKANGSFADKIRKDKITDTDKNQIVSGGDFAAVVNVYENNIGGLTQIVSGLIEEAVATYPVDWIIDAVGIAVKNNSRRWSYVEGVLKRWQSDGRGYSPKTSTNGHRPESEPEAHESRQEMISAIADEVKTVYAVGVTDQQFEQIADGVLSRGMEPGQVKGFYDNYWKEHGYYKGKPSLKSLLGEIDNYVNAGTEDPASWMDNIEPEYTQEMEL
jgi:DnaD/phage-associated family protein